MSIQGEANEFLVLLFGEMNEKRFAQVIKVTKINRNIYILRNLIYLGLFKIRSI